MQVLRNEPTGYAADLWALGCLLYRMLLGETPFAAASEYLIFERITSHDLHVPDTIAPTAQDLLKQLLDNDPKSRIGEAVEILDPKLKQERGIATGCARTMELINCWYAQVLEAGAFLNLGSTPSLQVAYKCFYLAFRNDY
jgi:serine/threonine protein kinase